MKCPDCNSTNIIKNGNIHNGKQKYECRECERQFVNNPTNKKISAETWEMVDKLLLEKIPLAGISKVTGISEPRLQKYLNRKYESIPKRTETYKIKGRLTIECDE